MNIEFWLLYISVVFIASIIPGPSMLLALTHGIEYGYKKSIYTALGNTTASVIQAIIAVSGLSIIFATSGIVFEVIRYAGAIYLIYLGIMLFKTKKESIFLKKVVKHKDISGSRMFTQAFLIGIGNPKAIIFFTALFPQFLSNGITSQYQFILLVASLGLIAFLCMMIYSIAGHKANSFFRSSTIGKYFNQITGGIFVGLGSFVALKD